MSVVRVRFALGIPDSAQCPAGKACGALERSAVFLLLAERHASQD